MKVRSYGDAALGYCAVSEERRSRKDGESVFQDEFPGTRTDGETTFIIETETLQTRGDLPVFIVKTFPEAFYCKRQIKYVKLKGQRL